MPLDPAQVQSVFQVALDLTGDARRAYLDAACATDATLRQELDSLFGWHACPESSLAAPVVERREGHPTLASGAYLGPYRIVSVLGAGGMGIVYRAFHEETGIGVALKTVRAHSDAAVAALRREIRALARLRHAGVVRVLEEGVTDGVPWYAMELVEAPDLRRLVTLAREHASPSPFPGPGAASRDVLVTLERLCGILAYVHGEGIVHRDLKPSHVLVRAGLDPVLVDFGLASSFAARTGRESIDDSYAAAGTVAYMAPEQIRGEPVDARTDLYALGCILFEVLTGRPPFVANDVKEVLNAHLSAPPPLPSSLAPAVSPQLDGLIGRLLAKDPVERLGYADVVGAALHRMVSDEPLPAGSRAPRPYLYRPRLVGRERLLKDIEQAVGPWHDRHGCLVMIEGESGAGKTRVLMEIARRARDHVVVLTGGARGGGFRGAPLHALHEPLSYVAERCIEGGTDAAGARSKVIAEVLPAFARIPEVDSMPAPEPLPPRDAELRLLSALADVLVEFAEDQPCLLLIDDLQWADELTLGLLELMAGGGHLGRHPLRVVAVFRAEECDERLRALASSRGVTHVPLPNLERTDVAQILADMLAWNEPDERLGAEVTRLSSGNAFFVAEYLLAAVAEGWLGRDSEGRWRAREAPVDDVLLPVPSTVSEIIRLRLSSLSPSARRIVGSASLLGREGSLALLREVDKGDDDEIERSVSELAMRHVFEDVGGDRFRFAHDQIVDAARREVGTDRRRLVARRIASAIETLPAGDPDRDVALVARCWEEAGESLRAGAAYLEAARDAVNAHALRRAEELYRSHFRLVDLESIESVRERNQFASAVLRPRGRFQEVIELLVPAVLTAERLGAADERLAVAATLARTYRALGRLDESKTLLEDILLQATQRSAAGLEAETLVALSMVYGDRGELQDCLDLAMRAARTAEEAGCLMTTSQAHVQVALAHSYLGLQAEAVASASTAVGWARRSGSRRQLADSLDRLAGTLCDVGRYTEANVPAQEADFITREIGALTLQGASTGVLAVVAWGQGRIVAAKGLFERSVALFRCTSQQGRLAFTLGQLGSVGTDLGCIEEARRAFDEAVEIFERLGARGDLGIVLMNYGVLCVSVGELRRGEAFLRDALALSQETRMSRIQAVVLQNLGSLDLVRGRWDEARDCLERSLAMLREAGDRREEGRTLGFLAALRVASGRLDDVETLLEQALAIARELGDRQGEAQVLTQQARVHRHRGRLAESQELLVRARELMTAASDPIGHAAVDLELGHLALALGSDCTVLLDRVRDAVDPWMRGEHSAIGDAVARLARARDAFHRGAVLVNGQAPEDVPTPPRHLELTLPDGS